MARDSFFSLLLPALALSCLATGCGDGSAGARGAGSDRDDLGGLDGMEREDIAPEDTAAEDTTLDTTDATDADADGDTGPPEPSDGTVRCTDDAECEGARCIFLIPDQDGFCFDRCRGRDACPEGQTCIALAASGGDLEQVCIPLDLCIDEDGDGWGAGPGCRGQDCDDTEPAVHFGAQEVCDGLDNNCDGLVDNATIDSGQRCDTSFPGVCAAGLTACVNSGLICEPLVPPSEEVCDGLDNNCNGMIDENAVDAPRWYRDADGDRFGDPDVYVDACARPDGYVDDGTDCDDTDRGVNPVANEVCDGRDTNCDGEVDNVPTELFLLWYVDEDGDGFGRDDDPVLACSRPEGTSAVGGDCDDTRTDVYPGAPEICDGVDNNCDGRVDPPSSEDAILWYPDGDEDGFGDRSATPIRACVAPEGHVANGLDCDDTDADVRPGVAEVCDGRDTNCNGLVDEAGAEGEREFWRDADGDGWGDATLSLFACTAPEGYVANAQDCNDANMAINPAATEVCDGVDNNCDGRIDVDAVDAPIWYRDADGDGFGDAAVSTRACTQPAGFVANNTDCNDANNTIFPGAPEICNGVDNNCNGVPDDGVLIAFWPDADADGFGNRDAAPVFACSAPPGHVANNLDCRDDIWRIRPGAPEICDGWDNNCDGVVDPIGVCPTGCLGHVWGARGYMSCKPGFGINRDNAQAVCAGDGRDMDLVQIDSLEENEAVAGMANSRWGTGWGQFWIGLTDRAEDRVFRWQNGTLATYLNWAGGEPNNFRGREDCADMDRNQGNRWRDVACSGNRNEFICRTR